MRLNWPVLVCLTVAVSSCGAGIQSPSSPEPITPESLEPLSVTDTPAAAIPSPASSTSAPTDTPQPTYEWPPSLDLPTTDLPAPAVGYLLGTLDPDFGMALTCFGELAAYDPSGELENGTTTILTPRDDGYHAGYIQMNQYFVCRDYQMPETAIAPDGSYFEYGNWQPASLTLQSYVLLQPGVWQIRAADGFALNIEVSVPTQPVLAQGVSGWLAPWTTVVAAGFEPGESLMVVVIAGEESETEATAFSSEAGAEDVLYELSYELREGQADLDGVLGPLDIAVPGRWILMIYVVGESGNIAGLGGGRTDRFLDMKPLDTQGRVIPRDDFFAILYQTFWPD